MNAQQISGLGVEFLDSAVALAQIQPRISVYLCGYYLELTIKASICKHLDWDNYPPAEFKKSDAVKTHDIKTLLLLAGKYKVIQADASLSADLNYIDSNVFGEKVRYDDANTYTHTMASNMIAVTKRLSQAL